MRRSEVGGVIILDRGNNDTILLSHILNFDLLPQSLIFPGKVAQQESSEMMSAHHTETGMKKGSRK